MTLKGLFGGEHGKKLLIVGAAALAVMLLLSTFTRRETKQPQSTERGVVSENAEEIERALERRLEERI